MHKALKQEKKVIDKGMNKLVKMDKKRDAKCDKMEMKAHAKKK